MNAKVDYQARFCECSEYVIYRRNGRRVFEYKCGGCALYVRQYLRGKQVTRTLKTELTEKDAKGLFPWNGWQCANIVAYGPWTNTGKFEWTR